MDIAQVKALLTIGEVLAHYNLKPDRSGRLRCPFHDDSTPSMQVYPDTNKVFCFSSNCEQSGKPLDVVDLVRLLEGVELPAALQKAQSLAGVFHPPAGGIGKPQKPPMKEKPSGDQKPNKALLASFFGSCVEAVKKSSKAQNYLEERGLNTELLHVGFNDGRFHRSWDDKLIANGVMSGLLSPHGSGHKVWAKGCLIFPLKDTEGKIISLYGRSLEKGHYYLKHRRGLYPCYPSASTKQLILTESIIDAASLVDADFSPAASVLALYGTNGLTSEHREAIESLSELQEIVLFLDGDQAGEKAAKKLSETLHESFPGVGITGVPTPEGEDPNSLLVKYGHEKIAELLEDRSILYSPAEPSPAPPKAGETTKAPGLRTNGVPTEPKLDTSNPEAITFRTEGLYITVLGGIKLAGLDRLRVTLKIVKENTHGFPLRHNLDLYHAQQVEKLIEAAASKLDCSSQQVRTAIEQLTSRLEAWRMAKLEALSKPKDEPKELTAKEKKQALKWLESSKLMERTQAALETAGIVGEELNRLLLYIIFTSRKMQRPLHAVSLGSSGTGKTHLQESLAGLMPAEDTLEITTLSENALYYFERDELKHKLLLIEDLDGAGEVLYPLRELQTKGKLSKTVALKDPKGNLKTITVRVDGPVSVAAATTREKLYEDNANRAFLLGIDESAAQDRRVLAYQRKLAAGQIDRAAQREAQAVIANAQRLLRPVEVRNPYAHKLKIPPEVFARRRANQLYLNLIGAVTFYHQYQRPVKTENGSKFIETTPEDIRWANKLAGPVLLRKADELSGACRQFLEELKSWLAENDKTHFYRKQIRATLRLHPSNLKRYMRDLQAYGYVKRSGGSRKTGYEYTLTGADGWEDLQEGVPSILDEALQDLTESTTS